MILLKPSAILKAVIKAPARAGDVYSSFKFQLVNLGLKFFMQQKINIKLANIVL